MIRLKSANLAKAKYKEEGAPSLDVGESVGNNLYDASRIDKFNSHPMDRHSKFSGFIDFILSIKRLRFFILFLIYPVKICEIIVYYMYDIFTIYATIHIILIFQLKYCGKRTYKVDHGITLVTASIRHACCTLVSAGRRPKVT